MTAIATIDFETYSTAGLDWDASANKWRSSAGAGATKRGLEVVGLKNYVNHPSFEILSLAYTLREGEDPKIWTPFDPTPDDLFGHIEWGGAVRAWNIGFEFTVWDDFCVKVLGWPWLSPAQLICSMAQARAWALPGALANAGEALNLNVTKDAEGKRLLKIFSVPRNPTKADSSRRIMPYDLPEEYTALLRYNAQDVRAEEAIDAKVPELSDFERRVWLCDQRINRRGLGVDIAGVENCIAIVEQVHDKYTQELITLTNGTVNSAGEVAALRDWLVTEGLFLDDLQAETVENALKEGLGNVKAARALRIRQMLGSASVKKLYAMQQQHFQGRLYDLYGYYAARTGRWNGHGPQPQNFPKPLEEFEAYGNVESALSLIEHRSLELIETVYPNTDPLDVVSSTLRSLLQAGEGKELVCSDFTAIEAVTISCLAVEPWRVEVFRSDRSIYLESASRITGTPIAEYEAYKREHGKHHPDRNAVGKIAELALSYGGWLGAWRNFDPDPLVPDDQIKRTILAWRDASPAIVEFWGGQSRGRFDSARPELYGLEGAAIAAVLYPGQEFAAGHYIRYQMRAGVLYCRLPSGRELAYHAPRVERSTREWANPWDLSLSFTGWNTNPKAGPVGWIRMNTYSGRLAENCTQAVARDFQAIALLALEERGYAPVLHSHDEIAAEVDVGWGSEEEFESIVNDNLPRWAMLPDGTKWPIKMSGGWRGKRYRKA